MISRFFSNLSQNKNDPRTGGLNKKMESQLEEQPKIQQKPLKIDYFDMVNDYGLVIFD